MIKDIADSELLRVKSLKVMNSYNSKHKTSSRFLVSITLVWFVFLGISPSSLVADSGLLSIRVLDEDGKTTPARAWVDTKDQRLFEPQSPDSATPYARDQSFSFDGSFIMDTPAGNAIVHIEKGNL